MLKSAIYNILKNDAGVSALTTCINPAHGEEDVVNGYVVYHLISAPRDKTMDGVLSQVQARIQVNCWSRTELGAENLAKAVSDAFEDYSGVESVSNTTIRYIWNIDSGDLQDWAAGQDEKMYGRRMDFYVWYLES
jgi:hypothetical protein